MDCPTPHRLWAMGDYFEWIGFNENTSCRVSDCFFGIRGGEGTIELVSLSCIDFLAKKDVNYPIIWLTRGGSGVGFEV